MKKLGVLFILLLGVFINSLKGFSQSIYSKSLEPRAHVTAGDVYVQDVGYGIVSKSDDGNCWRQKMANDGKTYWQSIPCSTNKKVTFSIQPSPEVGKEATVSSYNPDGIRGAYINMPIGYWTNGGLSNILQSFEQFDIPSIPANATIDSVYLYLYFVDSGGVYSQHSGSNAFYVRKITSTWDEFGTSWNLQPTSTSTQQISVPSTTNPYQDFKINVTNIVSSWFDSTTGSFPTNLGFIFVPQNTYSLNMVSVGSSDYLVPSKRPKLVVAYSIP